MSEVVGLLTVVLVLAGVFALGLAIFRGKIEMAKPSRPSPSFERDFPKIFGGFFMLFAIGGLVMIVLGVSGVFHKS